MGSQPSIMSSFTLLIASLLSLVILVHGDCVIDPSMPCECTNPFLGTDNFFLGDATKNCNAAKACYVKNLSGCADARQARGGGRCQSKLACGWTEVTTAGPAVAPGPVVTSPRPKCPPTGGSRICECKVQSECSSYKCEVDCQSDCNDLSSEGGKCFSEFACQKDLLFEIDCEP